MTSRTRRVGVTRLGLLLSLVLVLAASVAPVALAEVDEDLDLVLQEEAFPPAEEEPDGSLVGEQAVDPDEEPPQEELAMLGVLMAPTSTEHCPTGDGWTKEDRASGTKNNDFGEFSWSGKTLTYDLEPGYTLQFCLKYSTYTTTSGPVSGSGSVSVEEQDGKLHDISYISWRIVTGEPATGTLRVEKVVTGVRPAGVTFEATATGLTAKAFDVGTPATWNGVAVGNVQVAEVITGADPLSTTYVVTRDGTEVAAGSGRTVAAVPIAADETTTVTFTNGYPGEPPPETPEPTPEITALYGGIRVEKAVEGDPPADASYTFTVTYGMTTEAVTLPQDGSWNATFSGIRAGRAFTVTETGTGGADQTLVAVGAGTPVSGTTATGTVPAKATAVVRFTNIYEPPPPPDEGGAIRVTKSVDGPNVPLDAVYAFELRCGEDTTPFVLPIDGSWSTDLTGLDAGLCSVAETQAHGAEVSVGVGGEPFVDAEVAWVRVEEGATVVVRFVNTFPGVDVLPIIIEPETPPVIQPVNVEPKAPPAVAPKPAALAVTGMNPLLNLGFALLLVLAGAALLRASRQTAR